MWARTHIHTHIQVFSSFWFLLLLSGRKALRYCTLIIVPLGDTYTEPAPVMNGVFDASNSPEQR